MKIFYSTKCVTVMQPAYWQYTAGEWELQHGTQYNIILSIIILGTIRKSKYF